MDEHYTHGLINYFKGFGITSNEIMLPEALYRFLLVLSAVLIVLSVIMLVSGLIKKKSRHYFIAWGIVLLLSSLYLFLTMVTNSIIANTMVGG